jgi:hypothetical protein
MQTGVSAAQNMYGLSNQMVGTTMQTNSQTANNRLNNYYSLLGKGAEFAQSAMTNRTANQAQTNALTGQFANMGAGLASQAGQLGAGMLTSDQGARAGLMGQSMGVGNNLYNSNLGAMTGMSTSGLNFANSMMQQQTGMANNLANQYSGIGNQFAAGLQDSANRQAISQNALQQGGLANLMTGSREAAGDTANIYANLAGNVAAQNIYGNDIYGNATQIGAGIEANRLQQNAQLQILQNQYDRQQKSRNMAMGVNGGGTAFGLAMMGLGML